MSGDIFKNTGEVSKNLKLVLRIVMYSLYALIVISMITYTNRSWFSIGGVVGTAAAVLLWIIAIPGIIKRFDLGGNLKKIAVILMSNRRQLGIIMFLLALSHYLWLRAFGYIINGFPDPESFKLYERLGFAAFLTTIPLYITSNNFSVKLLKRNWTWLHKINYLTIWLLIFHSAFQPNGLGFVSIITSLVFLVQIVSWGYYFSKKNSTKK